MRGVVKSAFLRDATFVSFVVALLNVLKAREHAALMFCTNARRKYFPTKRRTPRARFIFASSSACAFYMPTHKRTQRVLFSPPPFYLFFSRSRGSCVGVGFFSLALICRPRARFEILSFVFLFRSLRFLGVKQTRERERFLHTKKNGRRRKKNRLLP